LVVGLTRVGRGLPGGFGAALIAKVDLVTPRDEVRGGSRNEEGLGGEVFGGRGVGVIVQVVVGINELCERVRVRVGVKRKGKGKGEVKVGGRGRVRSG